MSYAGTQVGPDTLVTVAYTLYDEDGDVLDRTDVEAPLSYLHGYGQIVPGLERALEGLSKGDGRSVVVPPALGYGEYDPEGVLEVERGEFPSPERIEVGDEFVAESPEGEEVPITVLEVKGDALLVDTNHPLAGETLRFDFTVIDVRPATDFEIAEAERALEPEPPLLSLGRKPKDRCPPS
jgi:FKBP-type peptidyl-prolyl cis-trans isomerase SlyD